MIFVPSEKVRKLGDEVRPYRIVTNRGVFFKDDTPDEIKEKYKLWEKLYSEEFDKAQEWIMGFE